MNPSQQSDSTSSIRPRNRRGASGQDATGSSSLSVSTPNSRTPSRGASPIPASRIGGVTGRNNSGNEYYAASPVRGKGPRGAGGGGLVDSATWAPSWASVQGFASSLISSSASLFTDEPEENRSRNVSRARSPRPFNSLRGAPKQTSSWGPEPPAESRPRLDDVAAGSRSQREARLKAMRTASVLESHEGVNGGLDVSGSFKKRNSDEILGGSSQNEEEGDHLVYIHHVQPADTYAGIVLKYRCHEDAFRKANGLWSRDNIQIRKWLAIPVDACEVRGRPCEGPTSPSAKVDLLARTPEVIDPFSRNQSAAGDDFFSSPVAGQNSGRPKTADEEQPWTHVRWVSLDSFSNPVEIGRVPRKALGYFPPRRKKSLLSGSRPSTPRGSVDVPSITLSGEVAVESPGSTSSRRPSLLSTRPQLSGAHTQTLGRGRGSSAGEDARPAWMRRPGGVGSMGKSVRAPGPAKDYFNSWAKKHIPGLDIDSLPSMSVMGAETARFGFSGAAEEQATIAESPFEDGRDISSTANQGTGLDKAAAAIETWLRGAFAKHPGTPGLGPRRRPSTTATPTDRVGDLIELTDTNSDDGRGRLPREPVDESSVLGSSAFGSSGWGISDGGGSMRGRTGGGVSGIGKTNKSD